MCKLETVKCSLRLTRQWKSKRLMLGALKKFPKAIISQFKMFVNNTGIRYSFSHHAVPVQPSVLPEQYFERSCCELNRYIHLLLGSVYSWNSSLCGFTAGPPQSCASVIQRLVSHGRRVGMIVKGEGRSSFSWICHIFC